MSYKFNTTLGTAATDHIAVPGFTTSQTRTYVIWAKPRTANPTNTFIATRGDWSSSQQEGIWSGSGDFSVDSVTSGAWRVTATGHQLSSTAAWTMLAATINGAVGMSLYVNGSAISQSTLFGSTGTIVSSSSDLNIGARLNSAVYAAAFDGRLAEVSIWNIVLSAQNLTDLAAGHRPTNGAYFSTAPIAYLPLLSDANADTYGSNGTVTGAVNDSGDHPTVDAAAPPAGYPVSPYNLDQRRIQHIAAM